MNTIAQIFPRTGRISGPEVADGAKPDVPTTDVENEKKTKHRVFYEVVDAHKYFYPSERAIILCFLYQKLALLVHTESHTKILDTTM